VCVCVNINIEKCLYSSSRKVGSSRYRKRFDRSSQVRVLRGQDKFSISIENVQTATRYDATDATKIVKTDDITVLANGRRVTANPLPAAESRKGILRNLRPSPPPLRRFSRRQARALTFADDALRVRSIELVGPTMTTWGFAIQIRSRRGV